MPLGLCVSRRREESFFRLALDLNQVERPREVHDARWPSLVDSFSGIHLGARLPASIPPDWFRSTLSVASLLAAGARRGGSGRPETPNAARPLSRARCRAAREAAAGRGPAPLKTSVDFYDKEVL